MKGVVTMRPEASREHSGNGNHCLFVRGTSSAMQSLERVIADIAPTDIPVLLVGESGTGKELVAAQIHQRSRRHDEPFVKLSCATLAPESFNGHGAWPVTESGNGRGPASGPGTLFLDELAELSPTCQPKLLYALPSGEILGPDPQGAAAPRLISSTSRNLDQEIRDGHFREELYYRINGVCLRLPPLRQHKEDIPLLVEHFLTKYSQQFERPRPNLSPLALRLLTEHHWPGNVRELENTIRKIVALGDEKAALADLSMVTTRTHSAHELDEGIPLKQAARAASRLAERELILKVLARTRWNRKRAAQELQISYKALLYKLKQIGVDDHVEI